jgi:CheY-like chemotaxis protein
MQAQTTEDQQTQTILIVEGDEATRRILDLSLRHAGFEVGLAAGGDEAAKKLAAGPDLLIATADDEGLTLCRQAKQTTGGIPPAVVLISNPDVESKRLGLEAGADDFVARPIYIQEVVTRARALLQRRERERIEVSAQNGTRFKSAIEDVPLVDLLRAIAVNQKSGVALIVDGAGARGEIFFRQGRVVDAEVGRLSGRDAVYRLFCWTSGQLEVEWKSIRRKDTIELPPQDLLMEALRRVDEWRRLLRNLPSLDTILEVDYRLLAERLADIPDEVNRILRLFDGMRTLMQVIDDCGLPDLDAAAAVGKLARERIVHDVRVPVEDEEAIGADMEGWLSDAAGPFRAPPRLERDLFGAGPGSGVGVHGRPTAPLDPLEAARDLLDADMRSRFTDRLAAEGQPAAAAAAPPDPHGPTAPMTAAAAPPPPPVPVPMAPAVAVPMVIEVPAAESGPTGNGARPTTLPGLGAAKDDSSRPAEEIPVVAAAPASSAAPAAGETVLGMPAAQPLLRAPRTASGEILVKKPPIRMKPSADGPLARARTTDERAPLPFMRPSQTSTPPGSARALDELPPFTDAAVVIAPQAFETATGSSSSGEFSAAAAADELGMPSRWRGLGLGLGAVVALALVGFLVVRPGRGHTPRTQAAGKPGEARSATVVSPTIEPLAAASGNAGAPRPVAAATPGGDQGMGARRTMPVAAVSPREDLDERAADPKMARTRVAEASTLLSACHVAFAEARMKDAEAACTAAKDANPDSAEAYGLLAHALFNRNRRREALGAAEKAVKINPKWADAYVIIGGVHQDAGESGEARRAYERYLELDPKGQYAPDLRAIVGKLEPAKM